MEWRKNFKWRKNFNWRKDFKKNGPGKGTKLLTEKGRIQGRENKRILNEYVLINCAPENIYQYSLSGAVCELPVPTVLPGLE